MHIKDNELDKKVKYINDEIEGYLKEIHVSSSTFFTFFG